MSTDAVSAIRPGAVDVQVADRAARRIRDYLATHPDDEPITVNVEVGGDDALVVPRAAAVMLAQVLQLLANGQGVQIMPDRAMLTSQQAADALNVSRPYLIGLLERGKIPFEMVGTHRRIAFADLLEYKRQDDQQRRAAADELTALGEELGED
ncbi:MAG TPA: helix-turn-helix domain-containing protein [Streptosporangiaceae bacterium]|jgi:excisionase family DNA binding protein